MRVRGIIAEQIGVAPGDCPESAAITGLSLDELDAVAIVLALGDSLDIELSAGTEEMLLNALQVGEFIDLVEGQVRAGGIA